MSGTGHAAWPHPCPVPGFVQRSPGRRPGPNKGPLYEEALVWLPAVPHLRSAGTRQLGGSWDYSSLQREASVPASPKDQMEKIRAAAERAGATLPAPRFCPAIGSGNNIPFAWSPSWQRAPPVSCCHLGPSCKLGPAPLPKPPHVGQGDGGTLLMRALVSPELRLLLLWSYFTPILLLFLPPP